jgi:HEAT repeat protein
MSKQNMTGTNLESLIEMLANKNSVTRQNARKSLVVLGKPAVPPLIRLLKDSKLDHLRWEAVKTLDAICDERAIPSLVKALEDSDIDVAWLAAEALKKYKKAAWPVLLNALIKSGEDSVQLRNGVHHILLKQKENGFGDLLKTLMKALKSNAASESTTIAANEIIKRMKGKP